MTGFQLKEADWSESLPYPIFWEGCHTWLEALSIFYLSVRYVESQHRQKGSLGLGCSIFH